MKTETLKILVTSSLILIAILFWIRPTQGHFVSVINQDENSMISLNLYDKNNNPINNQETFSVINSSQTNWKNIPGVYSLDFTVMLDNIGTEVLNCSIISATPVSFYNSLPKTSLILKNQGAVSWTSNRINTSQFEGQNPTRFNVTVKCNSTIKSSFIDLLIGPEYFVDYRTLYPNIEGSSSTIGTNTDEFAWSSSCGGSLIAVREVTGSSVLRGPSGWTCVDWLTNPGHWNPVISKVMDINSTITSVTETTYGYSATQHISLWYQGGTTNAYYICADGAPSNYPLTIKFKVTGSPVISTSKNPQYTNLEHRCN